MPNTREIEAFLAVAEELHFGRAAERLHRTTSSVSQAVRALERRVGARLFERTSRTVRLTSLGGELLAALGPAYRRLDEILREARRSAGTIGTTITVGFSASLLPGMPEVLAGAFENSDSGSRLVTVGVNPLDMFQWNERVGLSLDAIVGWLPPGAGGRPSPALSAGPAIRRSRPALLMSERHPLAGRPSVDIEELAELDVLLANSVAEAAPAWVPARTPGGRPIRRIRRDIWYIENLLAMLPDSTLVHHTMLDFGQTLPLTGLALVPLTGRGPYECRTVWPTARETPAVRDFARSAARAGQAAGWLKLG